MRVDVKPRYSVLASPLHEWIRWGEIATFRFVLVDSDEEVDYVPLRAELYPHRPGRPKQIRSYPMPPDKGEYSFAVNPSQDLLDDCATYSIKIRDVNGWEVRDAQQSLRFSVH